MRLLTILMVLLPCAARAADPFACVEPDFTDAFLGNWFQPQPDYSTHLPAGFIDLDVPESFSLVGSESSDRVTRVVYKTGLKSTSALNAAVAALTDAGWRKGADHRLSGGGGFQTGSRPKYATVCGKDGESSVTITSKSVNGRAFIAYTEHLDSQNCNRSSAAMLHRGGIGMMAQMPVLEVPEEEEISNSGMSGSGDEFVSRVDLSGTLGRSGLQSHFEEQIKSQGWEFQDSWSSPFSSGSVWTLDSAEDGLLVGTLHVYGTGAGPARVQFRLSPANPRRGSGEGSWSSVSSG